MRILNRDIVGAPIYSKDGKLFLAKGATGGVYPNTWKIPGGGVEEGESKEQAMAREVLEETGIDVSNCKMELVDDTITGEGEKTLKGTGERVYVKMKFFTYKIVLDTNAADVMITLDSDEFDEYQWIELDELRNITLSPPSTELFTRFGYL